ncbi:MAG TPA: LAGLIDADG family homing endonuclease [Candidatus Nanoarchaeia archaeon]|nr:LAGLIDADG family homing endonuclease [Candidatus Nanoarchaeia archaeon]
MKFNKNLAAIHGYLCSDGYVIKNPDTQKHKYYHIGLRNTNNVLLLDFQEKFEAIFSIKPIITNEGRCKIQNKDIYKILTEDFSFYSYEWKLPELKKDSLSYWLRAFFDCEGWVENQPAKSRLIGADCCNESGLLSVQEALRKFGIDSEIKKRKGRIIWRLTICGIEDLKKFHKYIGFLHPNKNQKLNEAINSYKDFSWGIPKTKDELFKFIIKKGKIRNSRNEVRFMSIKKLNLQNLKKALKDYSINSEVFGPWKNNTGSLYYCLIIKNFGGTKWNGILRDQKTSSKLVM